MYAHFVQSPLLTHFVTMFSLAALTFSILKKHPGSKLLAYNRSYHYLPALVVAWFMRASIFLDLEDGYINESNGVLGQIKNAITKKLFDVLCPSGALLAASALSAQVESPHTLVCYGVASELQAPAQDWSMTRLKILFGGTLLEEVGSQLLLDALVTLLARHPNFFKEMELVVTGKGPWEGPLSELANNYPTFVTFAKDLSAEKYAEILRTCHIGLSLRLSKYAMGATTFPSKVLEYAGNGLLVVSTRTSDVPVLMGSTAIYLDQESPEGFAELLLDLSRRRVDLQSVAINGFERVVGQCNRLAVGNVLAKFFSVN
ncbi:glycosyltransferase [Polynucleobacter sp.]|uniref:glycosyltransferase n=1 Tax=Polynucleobacter sp. TaxID=2029855 RepID=UPI00272953F6|nr:glycosyltransferase [Polynucleobacter sp.]